MWDEDTPWFTVPLLPESLLTMGFVSLTKVLLLFKRLGIKMFRNNNFFDSVISPIFMMGTRLPLPSYVTAGSSYVTATKEV